MESSLLRRSQKLKTVPFFVCTESSKLVTTNTLHMHINTIAIISLPYCCNEKKRHSTEFLRVFTIVDRRFWDGRDGRQYQRQCDITLRHANATHKVALKCVLLTCRDVALTVDRFIISPSTQNRRSTFSMTLMENHSIGLKSLCQKIYII